MVRGLPDTGRPTWVEGNAISNIAREKVEDLFSTLREGGQIYFLQSGQVSRRYFSEN